MRQTDAWRRCAGPWTPHRAPGARLVSSWLTGLAGSWCSATGWWTRHPDRNASAGGGAGTLEWLSALALDHPPPARAAWLLDPTRPGLVEVQQAGHVLAPLVPHRGRCEEGWDFPRIGGGGNEAAVVFLLMAVWAWRHVAVRRLGRMVSPRDSDGIRCRAHLSVLARGAGCTVVDTRWSIELAAVKPPMIDQVSGRFASAMGGWPSPTAAARRSVYDAHGTTAVFVPRGRAGEYRTDRIWGGPGSSVWC